MQGAIADWRRNLWPRSCPARRNRQRCFSALVELLRRVRAKSRWELLRCMLVGLPPPLPSPQGGGDWRDMMLRMARAKPPPFAGNAAQHAESIVSKSWLGHLGVDVDHAGGIDA